MPEIYFAQNLFPSLLNEKKRFSRQKTVLNLSGYMHNSMCHNGHGVVNELCRLKILRTFHPSYSLIISPCGFWMFDDFKRKLKDSHLQGLEAIFWPFEQLRHNITFEELQIVFES
jgi:hypothetical protein